MFVELLRLDEVQCIAVLLDANSLAKLQCTCTTLRKHVQDMEGVWQHKCDQLLSGPLGCDAPTVAARELAAYLGVQSCKELCAVLTGVQGCPVGLWYRVDEGMTPQGDLVSFSACGEGTYALCSLACGVANTLKVLRESPVLLSNLADTGWDMLFKADSEASAMESQLVQCHPRLSHQGAAASTSSEHDGGGDTMQDTAAAGPSTSVGACESALTRESGQGARPLTPRQPRFVMPRSEAEAARARLCRELPWRPTPCSGWKEVYVSHSYADCEMNGARARKEAALQSMCNLISRAWKTGHGRRHLLEGSNVAPTTRFLWPAAVRACNTTLLVDTDTPRWLASTSYIRECIKWDVQALSNVLALRPSGAETLVGRWFFANAEEASVHAKHDTTSSLSHIGSDSRTSDASTPGGMQTLQVSQKDAGTARIQRRYRRVARPARELTKAAWGSELFALATARCNDISTRASTPQAALEIFSSMQGLWTGCYGSHDMEIAELCAVAEGKIRSCMPSMHYDRYFNRRAVVIGDCFSSSTALGALQSGHSWPLPHDVPQVTLLKIRGDPNVPANEYTLVFDLRSWKAGNFEPGELDFNPVFVRQERTLLLDRLDISRAVVLGRCMGWCQINRDPRHWDPEFEQVLVLVYAHEVFGVQMMVVFELRHLGPGIEVPPNRTLTFSPMFLDKADVPSYVPAERQDA